MNVRVFQVHVLNTFELEKVKNHVSIIQSMRCALRIDSVLTMISHVGT